MKTPLVTFFADIDGRTYYSDHAKRFIKNCKDLNMPFIVKELQSRGDYRTNCLSKPKFLLDMIKEINVPFVWMDVDSIMHKQLNIFDELSNNCDIGFAFPKIPTKEDNSIALPKASPIYINNTAASVDFLHKWAILSENAKNNNLQLFDHEILIKIFLENIGKIRIGCLPMAYCVWPGEDYSGEKCITMGLADGVSKENTLKNMGFSEEEIKKQSIGNKFIQA